MTNITFRTTSSGIADRPIAASSAGHFDTATASTIENNTFVDSGLAGQSSDATRHRDGSDLGFWTRTSDAVTNFYVL